MYRKCQSALAPSGAYLCANYDQCEGAQVTRTARGFQAR